MFGLVNVEDIYSHKVLNEHFSILLQDNLELSSLSALLRPDDFNLDIFHHGIIAANSTMVKVLVRLLCQYPSVCQNKLPPYLHFAAIMGHEQLVDDIQKLCDLIQPNEKTEVPLWWRIIESLVSNINFRNLVHKFICEDHFNLIIGKFESFLHETYQNKEKLYSAVDIAVICKNTSYFDIFLQKITQNKTSSSTFAKVSAALDICSARALKVLTENIEEDKLYKLLTIRVKELDFDASKLLLDLNKIDVKKIREEGNLFHFACSSRVQHAGLDDLVSLLTEKGFDVNDGYRPCTYPLYSMINSFVCERDINPKKVPEHHIRSIKLMLSAGANPNFDERKVYESQEKKKYSLIHLISGRDPSNSALDCFFNCLQFLEKWDPYLMEQLDQICLLLLENGADPSYYEVCYGSPLHSLMQLSACHHAQGHLSADFFSMSRMLLYFGADPDFSPKKNSCYPIQFYFTRIFDLMGGRIAFDRWKKSGVVSQIAGLLTYMNRDHASIAYHSICEDVDRVRSSEDGMNEETALKIKSTLLEFLTPIRPLQDFCKLALWRGSGRKVENLKQLNMPRRMMREITSFFALEI